MGDMLLHVKNTWIINIHVYHVTFITSRQPTQYIMSSDLCIELCTLHCSCKDNLRGPDYELDCIVQYNIYTIRYII